jgi:TolC family type I secretion outer membrane protein
MITRVVAIAALAVLLAATAAAAQTAESQATPLTLEEAVATALAHNPGIQAARSQVDASRERITQARSGFLPQISFKERYSNTTNPMWAFGTKLNQGVITREDFDPQSLNDPDSINNFASVFSLVWPVFDSGQTWYGHKQAKLGSEIAGFGLERTRQQVTAQTIIRYTGLLLAMKNLAVVEQALESARVNLKMVSSRYKTGFFVKSDLLRAQVRIGNLEQQRLQAESAVAIAQAGLNAVMGVAVTREHDPVSVLGKAAEPRGSLASWIQTALERRLDLKQLRYQKDIAAQEFKKARAAHLPSLHLMGNYEINSEKFDGSHDNYTVGAELNLNLYSGSRLSARAREARALLQAVEARLRDMELGIRVQTRQAFLQSRSTWEAIQVAKISVSQAEEGLRIVKNRYKNGLVTMVDLLDSEVALQQARTHLFRRLHDYKVSSTRLALAAGTIDENTR